jgi:tetratricopeptide (TPR) repeat protein
VAARRLRLEGLDIAVRGDPFRPRPGLGVKKMKEMTRNITTAAALLVVLAASGCSDKINYLRARSSLNSGVKAFEAADFPRAVEHFGRAIELDPALMDARTYRACAYMMQYVPAGESEDNERIAEQAIAGFQEVLARDPGNKLAQEYVASLYYNMKEFDKAKKAYSELLALNPDHKIAHYTIGVIDWAQTYEPRLEVRADLGMKPDDPGPIKDKKAREELAAKNLPLVEEGLQHLQKAVAIDPQYDDAMVYINLLYREQADISETKEEFEKLNAMAEDWVQKALDSKKLKAEASTKQAF